MFVRSVMKSFMLHYARIVCIMLIGILVNIMSESPSAQDVKSYTIVRADGKIAIDGRLDEKAWDKAAEAVLTETNTGNKVPKKSTVKLLWTIHTCISRSTAKTRMHGQRSPNSMIPFGARKLLKSSSIPRTRNIPTMKLK